MNRERCANNGSSSNATVYDIVLVLDFAGGFGVEAFVLNSHVHVEKLCVHAGKSPEVIAANRDMFNPKLRKASNPIFGGLHTMPLGETDKVLLEMLVTAGAKSQHSPPKTSPPNAGQSPLRCTHHTPPKVMKAMPLQQLLPIYNSENIGTGNRLWLAENK
eukprot:442300-Amphidinium_carterae.1